MNKLFKAGAAVLGAVSLSACASLGDPGRTTLPLDHGPRAQSTPWLNHQLALYREKQSRAQQGDGRQE